MRILQVSSVLLLAAGCQQAAPTATPRPDHYVIRVADVADAQSEQVQKGLDALGPDLEVTIQPGGQEIHVDSPQHTVLARSRAQAALAEAGVKMASFEVPAWLCHTVYVAEASGGG